MDLQEQAHVHTSIKFEFVMDSLVINLFTGGSKTVITKIIHYFYH